MSILHALLLSGIALCFIVGLLLVTGEIAWLIVSEQSPIPDVMWVRGIIGFLLLLILIALILYTVTNARGMLN